MSARRRSLAAALAAAALLAGCVAATAQSNGRYAIEFRARSGGFFGHTYVAYGRVDGDGRLADTRYAGFYPSGVLTDSPFLAVLAAPGFVNLKPRDRVVRSDLVYRREIDARSYARLPYEVQVLRRAHPMWHLTFYNCNSFVGDIAASLGMRVPPDLEVPKDFVRDLYALNMRTAPGIAYAAVSGRRVSPPDMLFLAPPPR